MKKRNCCKSFKCHEKKRLERGNRLTVFYIMPVPVYYFYGDSEKATIEISNQIH